MASRRDARRARRRERDAGTPVQKAAAPPAHYRIGRFLQFLGLLVLPFGIVSELVGRVGLGQSLLIAGGGALLFYAGYVIQNRPAV